jgi:hypothetical protein
MYEFGKIIIQPDAVVKYNDKLWSNAYIVFKRGEGYNVDAIECAYYLDTVELEELFEEYPLEEYVIIHGDVNDDLVTGKQTIDLYESDCVF